MGGWSRAGRSMTSASTGRFSDCNKLWRYHWISLVQLALRLGWMRLELGEFTGNPSPSSLLSANNNLSDNPVAGDLKQRRQCYLFDLSLLASSALRICEEGQRCLGHPQKSLAAGAAEVPPKFCGILSTHTSSTD